MKFSDWILVFLCLCFSLAILGYQYKETKACEAQGGIYAKTFFTGWQCHLDWKV